MKFFSCPCAERIAINLEVIPVLLDPGKRAPEPREEGRGELETTTGQRKGLRSQHLHLRRKLDIGRSSGPFAAQRVVLEHEGLWTTLHPVTTLEPDGARALGGVLAILVEPHQPPAWGYVRHTLGGRGAPSNSSKPD